MARRSFHGLPYIVIFPCTSWFGRTKLASNLACNVSFEILRVPSEMETSSEETLKSLSPEFLIATDNIDFRAVMLTFLSSKLIGLMSTFLGGAGFSAGTAAFDATLVVELFVEGLGARSLPFLPKREKPDFSLSGFAF